MNRISDKKTNTKTCPNCGNETSGNFCPNCGQSTVDVNISVKHFFKDFLGDYFTFDSKFFRSIIPLIFRPGFLTNEFAAGRRIRYIPPMRMYIFMSVIFFFILSMSSHKSEFIKFSDDSNAVDSSAVVIAPIKVSPSFPFDSTAKTINFSETIKIDETAETDSAAITSEQESPGVIAEKMSKAEHDKTKFTASFISNLPKMMFLLLPLFALLLKLVYARSKILYVKHLIFSLHFHTFVFFVLSTVFLFTNFFEIITPETKKFVSRITMILITLYLFIDLKVVYRQSWLKTFFKMGLLSFSYVILFGAAMVGIFIFSLYLL